MGACAGQQGRQHAHPVSGDSHSAKALTLHATPRRHSSSTQPRVRAELPAQPPSRTRCEPGPQRSNDRQSAQPGKEGAAAAALTDEPRHELVGVRGQAPQLGVAAHQPSERPQHLREEPGTAPATSAPPSASRPPPERLARGRPALARRPPSLLLAAPMPPSPHSLSVLLRCSVYLAEAEADFAPQRSECFCYTPNSRFGKACNTTTTTTAFPSQSGSQEPASLFGPGG